MLKFNVSIVRTYEIDLGFDQVVEARTKEEAEGYIKGVLDGSCEKAEGELQESLPDGWSFDGTQIRDKIEAEPILHRA